MHRENAGLRHSCTGFSFLSQNHQLGFSNKCVCYTQCAVSLFIVVHCNIDRVFFLTRVPKLVHILPDPIFISRWDNRRFLSYSPDSVRVHLDTVTSWTFQISFRPNWLLCSLIYWTLKQLQRKAQNLKIGPIVLCWSRGYFPHESLHVWDIKPSIVRYSFMIMLGYKEWFRS